MRMLTLEAIVDAVRNYMLLMPKEYQEEKYVGELIGYYIPETKCFNVLNGTEQRNDKNIISLGYIFASEEEMQEVEAEKLSAVWTEDGLQVKVSGSECDVDVNYYTLKKELFSRNQGIVECDQMKQKQVLIIGCGSGGSYIAVQLAKAGIGEMILVDGDVFGYQNICRHQCGVSDVGKPKVDAVKERIININPYCKVHTFFSELQHVDPEELQSLVKKDAVIACCTDNRHAGYVCNELADTYGIPMVVAGCGPMASTGEVFYYKPECGMPCYACAFGEDKGVDYSNQNVRRAFYATERELEKLHFQPGMAIDMEYTAMFQTKLIVDLLMENEPEYKGKLLPYVKQCTVLMNYDVDEEVNPYVQLFTERKPMTWKTGSVEKNKECTYCHS